MGKLCACRYDLLCQEGLAQALRVFEGQCKPPQYKLVKPASGKLQQIVVKPEVRYIIYIYKLNPGIKKGGGNE